MLDFIKKLQNRALFGPALIAMSIAAMASPAHAATQGTLGATSTGTVNISASVPARAQITGLSDVAFTGQNPASAASNAQDVCVWTNTASKQYRVTATGDGTASAFTVGSGALAPVPYSVQWSGSVGQASGTALTTTAISTVIFGSTAANPTCTTGGETASLIVGIASSDLMTMQAAATYAGVLTLLITPV